MGEQCMASWKVLAELVSQLAPSLRGMFAKSKTMHLGAGEMDWWLGALAVTEDPVSVLVTGWIYFQLQGIQWSSSLQGIHTLVAHAHMYIDKSEN